MAALDQGRAAVATVQPPRRGPHVLQGFGAPPQQHRHLVQIGRDQRRPRQQMKLLKYKADLVIA